MHFPLPIFRVPAPPFQAREEQFPCCQLPISNSLGPQRNPCGFASQLNQLPFLLSFQCPFAIQTTSSPMDPSGWTTNYLLPTPVAACTSKKKSFYHCTLRFRSIWFPVNHSSPTSSFLRPLTTQGDPTADTGSERMKRKSKQYQGGKGWRSKGWRTQQIWLMLVFEGKTGRNISIPTWDSPAQCWLQLWI